MLSHVTPVKQGNFYRLKRWNYLEVLKARYLKLILNKLKSEIKNSTDENLNLSSNVIGNFNDQTNFPHKLLFTNTQVSRLCKAFANNSSVNTKLLKTQLFKIG